MDIQAIKATIPTSPAFFWEALSVQNTLKTLSTFRELSGCKILYSIKALPLVAVLEIAKSSVDGFSVSSLFEARLADEVLAGFGSIHLTTPGIRVHEIDELITLCTHISANSIGQFETFAQKSSQKLSLGLRINPKLSAVDDPRYDPCRQFSKLGVDLEDMIASSVPEQAKGLHFHTVFSASDYSPLLRNLDKIERSLGDKLSKFDWINVGGGYLLDQINENLQLITRIARLREKFNLDVFIEPGKAVVGNAGYLLATVIDCFKSDGKCIAVLDTSINHHPEVFEYQRQPTLFEHDPKGGCPVLLAGSTCLAGDLFGEYRFKKPLIVGEKLVFQEVGAYSLVKANRFNGYNLPDVYWVNGTQLRCIKQHTYQAFRQLWMTDCS